VRGGGDEKGVEQSCSPEINMNMTLPNCYRCGTCCINNGLIPPWLSGEEVPEWLSCLVTRLRSYFADVAEEFPCVFLTDDLRCAIHDLAKPSVCAEFVCDSNDVKIVYNLTGATRR